MKKALFIALLFAATQAVAQTAPVSPVLLSTNSAYLEPSTGRHWYYNGATYFWWNPYTWPQGTTAQYIRGDGSLATLPAPGAGTVTSITPGVGFLSHTPITTSGTMNIDSAFFVTPWQFLHGNNAITGEWNLTNQNNNYYGSLVSRDVGGGHITYTGNGMTWNGGASIGGSSTLNYYASAHDFKRSGDGFVWLHLGDGSTSPNSYAPYLQVWSPPLGPWDVMNKRSTDSLFAHKGDTPPYITPNLFSGSDIVRIRKAIDSANTTTHVIHIPNINSRDGGLTWLIDSAILIPSKMTVYIDGAKIKLSDQSRDNFFRSSNVGYGITSPSSVSDIAIIGTGNAVLEGADNPRATGDGSKTLSLTTNISTSTLSYGSDAAVPAQKQTGDWRNYGIVLGYVNGVTIKGLTMRKTHGWAIDLERCDDVNVTDIVLDNDQTSVYNGTSQIIRNRDGVNLVFGARGGNISDISGRSGDDGLAYAMSADSTRGTAGTYVSVVTGFQFVAATDTIRDVNTSNVNLYDGLGSVMALRPGEGTWRRMFNMNFDNITDSGLPGDYIHTTGAVFLLGRYTASMGTNNPASFKNISFSNIKNNLMPYAFNVVGTMSNSTITGAIKSNAGSFFNYTAGNGGLYNVQVNNSQDQTSVYNNWLVTGNAGTSEQSIKITKSDSSMQVTDSRTLAGLKYAADYSAKFVARSLPDRAYNDARYAAIGATAGGDLTGTYPNPTIALTTGTGNYVKSASPTLTGTAIMAGITQSAIWTSNMAANTNRQAFMSGGLNRWILILSGAESTGDLGSDYVLLKRHDDGTANGTALSIARATGILTLPAYGTGIYHFNSSGVGSSSTIVTADIATSAVTTAKADTASGFVSKTFAARYATINGSPTFVTQAGADNSTKAATTAFIKNQGYAVNPMTTQGDIIIGGASGTPARLALSAAGNFPVSNGTTIVNTAFSGLASGDFIYWNGTNWANRSMTVTGFRTWNNSTATLSNANHFIFTPATGGTVTLLNNQENIINPAGALVALTLALPASPANNDKIAITFTQSVTTISYSGGTVVGGLTTIAQGGQYYLTYDTSTTTWY